MSDFDWSFSEYPLGEDDKPLSKRELKELGAALGDGFTSVLLVRGPEITSIEGVIDEPFWGATLRAPKSEIEKLEELKAELATEGYTHTQALEYYLDNIELDISDDAPTWAQSNPFNFDPAGLESYFVKKCDEALGDTPLLCSNGGSYHYSDFVELAKPYSRIWFELHAANELWLLRALFKDFEKEGAVSSFWVQALIRRAGVIGRLIEGYRWRFAYGDHALRGKKVVGNAGKGGQVRAAKVAHSTRTVLHHMSKLIDNGHSISRAAELAHSRGVGSSPSANKKLWSRHRRK